MWYLMLSELPDDIRAFDPASPGHVFFFSFMNGIILYGYLIPISLYVSVEMAKVIQALYFINFDEAMYDAGARAPPSARVSVSQPRRTRYASVLCTSLSSPIHSASPLEPSSGASLKGEPLARETAFQN